MNINDPAFGAKLCALLYGCLFYCEKGVLTKNRENVKFDHFGGCVTFSILFSPDYHRNLCEIKSGLFDNIYFFHLSIADISLFARQYTKL